MLNYYHLCVDFNNIISGCLNIYTDKRNNSNDKEPLCSRKKGHILDVIISKSMHSLGMFTLTISVLFKTAISGKESKLVY